jgi:nucleoid DNA-binding protein
MNKTEIVYQIHQELDKSVTLKNIDAVIDKFLDVISENLNKGEDIQLANFGTLSLSKFAVKPAEKFISKK